MNRQDFSTGITRNISPSSDLTEDELDDLKIELAKVEDEIQTLRQVLYAKERYAMELKNQLGLSPLSSLKQNLSRSWHDIQTSSPYLSAASTLEDISKSNTYKRTQDTLSQAGQATSAALSSAGVAITRRLGQMRALPLPSPPRTSLAHSMSVPTMSRSATFKSFEGMVGSMKDKVKRSHDGNHSGFERRASGDGSF